MTVKKRKKPLIRSGHMELSVVASLFDSDSKEEAIFHLKLVGSSENDPSVNLPFKKGGGAENIQLATRLHP